MRTQFNSTVSNNWHMNTGYQNKKRNDYKPEYSNVTFEGKLSLDTVKQKGLNVWKSIKNGLEEHEENLKIWGYSIIGSIFILGSFFGMDKCTTDKQERNAARDTNTALQYKPEQTEEILLDPNTTSSEKNKQIQQIIEQIKREKKQADMKLVQETYPDKYREIWLDPNTSLSTKEGRILALAWQIKQEQGK